MPELLEVTLAAVTAAVFALAGVAEVLAVRSREAVRRTLLGRAAALAAAVGLGVLTWGIALRWAAIGHPPIFGSFENGLAASWALVAGVLVMRRVREWRHIGLGLYPGAALTLLWGLRFNTHRLELTISERSLWVDVHALVAWVAYAALAMMLCAALLALARALEARRGRPFRMLEALPDAAWTEELVAVSASWSFVGFTAVIVSGAWYSYLLFGETWRWDTVEVLALVVWLVLALALHARLFFGWRGARLAALLALGYVGVLAVYWVLALVPFASYHFFELPF